MKKLLYLLLIFPMICMAGNNFNILDNTLSSGGVLGIYNFNPQNYKNARKMISNVMLGVSNGDVLCLGDSTTAGYNGVSHLGESANSWVARTAQNLTLLGIPSGWQSWFNDKNVTITNLPTYDGRITIASNGTNWINFLASTGGLLLSNTASQDKITFTPSSGTTDTLDLYYFDGSGYDTINVFGGATGATAASPATVAITSTQVVKKATFTSAGTVTWAVQKANVNSARFIPFGMNAYNSATKQINMMSFGGESLLTSNFTDASASYTPLGAITAAGGALTGTTTNPKLAFYFLGINDAIQSSTGSTSANATATIAALQAVNTDVVVIIPFNFSSGVASIQNQLTMQSAMYAVANSCNCAVIPLNVRWDTFSSSNTLGYFGDLAIHPSNFAYQDISSVVSNLILALSL